MDNKQQLNNFAAFALQALIAKMPLLDREGALGPSEDVSKIKSEIAESAWEYAEWMLYHQQKAHEWVDKNFPASNH